MTSTDTAPVANVIAEREAWLNRFAVAAAPAFEAAGYPIPLNLRISVGLPPEGYRSKTIGVCFYPEASSDGHFEIFINPTVSEGDARMAGILTHELCHAAVHASTGQKGHGAQFKACSKAVGLVGKLTATTEGPDWFAWSAAILSDLGPMNFGALSMRPAKKKATYLYKLECPDCGWLVQATKSHVFPHTHLNCAVPDCGGIMVYHHPDLEG